MVHRDIKPDNIVLVQTPDGEQAKVLDFGIAKVKEGRGEKGGMTLTGTGVVIGTPQYMSPEQAMGKRGDELDGRSDLYSLGIVMYQMLTGELPFKADTTMEMLIAHVQQPPIDVCTVHPELRIPGTVASVAMRLLEKKAENRPETALALIEEIESAEAGITTGVMGETHVISPIQLTDAAINVHQAPPPPPPVQRPGRIPAAQTAQTTGPARRVATPPPVPPAPPREAPLVRPAPPPPPAARIRVKPPPVVPVKKPSQAGIWAALAILVVALGGGVWYFSEHRPSVETEPVNPTPSPEPVNPLGGTQIIPTPEPGPNDSTEKSGGSQNPLEVVIEPTLPPKREEQPKKRTREFVKPPVVVERRREPEPVKPVVDTKRVSAALKMGEFYFERGEYEKAIEEFRQGLALDPSNRELRSRIARARRAKAAEELLNQ